MNFHSILNPSLLKDQLDLLARLYNKADLAVDHFVKISGVSCPAGCGSCCEGFVPDILPLEAAALAAFIAIKNRPMAFEMAAMGLSSRDGSTTSCPLYNKENPYHCSVYEARPLICRLFAFSAVKSKIGEEAFSVCRHGLSSSGIRKAKGGMLKESFGIMPPVMADFGMELAAMEPDSSADRKILPEAVQLAMPKVLFIIGLGNSDPWHSGPGLKPLLTKAG